MNYEDIKESERLYLGAMLAAAAWKQKIESRLQANDFETSLYGQVFKEILKQIEDEIIPDITTLAEKFPDNYAEIAAITNAVPSGAVLHHYENIIYSASMERAFRDAMARADGELKNHTPVEAVINNLLPALSAVTIAKNESAIVTSTELLNTQYPPYEWIVPDLIGQGLTLLVGAPKIGKSWLVLSLATAVAAGGYVLGTKKAIQNDVLYLAIEDTPRRLNTRLKKIGARGSGQLRLTTQWKNGTTGLRNYLKQYPEIKLVIIDTFGRFTGIEDVNDYAATTAAMANIKSVADDLDVAIVVIHHTKKAGKTEPTDWTENALGSTGLTGAVDSILMLTRTRESFTGKLNATGRDAPDLYMNLILDPHCMTWTENKATDPPQKKGSGGNAKGNYNYV